MIKHPMLVPIAESIKTERMVLRRYTAEDGDIVYSAIESNRDWLRPWMVWADQSYTATLEFMHRSIAQWQLRESLGFGMFRLTDQAFIGSVSLHNIEWDIPKLEIGYWMQEKFSGQGYMTEAVNAVTEYTIHHFQPRKLEIWCLADNHASANVARRTGYQLFSTDPNSFRDKEGKLHDYLGFGKWWADEQYERTIKE
jgi:RimJ/RimL family protein N-acetyltransferase